MKLISLNTWGGRHFKSLSNFAKKHKGNTDIFCFQETFSTSSGVKGYKEIIRANFLEELQALLPKFKVYYFVTMEGFDAHANPVNFDLKFGQAVFIRKSIHVSDHKNYFIYKDKNFKKPDIFFSNVATPLQKIQFEIEGKIFSIFNFHGTPYPAAKKDTRKRLKQSLKMKKIIDKSPGSKILVGDFNLSKNTKSIRTIELEMRNLIKEFKIKRTRSRLSPFFGKSNFQKFADYTFVSKDIKVKSFEVPDVKISDHLPMILEFTN